MPVYPGALPRRREDDRLIRGAVGRTHAPAGWLADGPRRAQTVLALPEPDPSGSMRFVVSRAPTWVRCGIQPMARSDVPAAKRTGTCGAGQDEPSGARNSHGEALGGHARG